MSIRGLLVDGANELGVSLTDKQVQLFNAYLNNLKSWNKKINLTAIKDDEGVIIHHFLDSLSISPMIEDNKSLLDIGTGGGFPGLPLKIIKPQLRVTLLDSVNKKISFLNDTIRKLELKDIEALWGRAEDSENNIPRGFYDYVVTRAVGSISDTIYLSSPYLSESGLIVLMRGKRGSEEWGSVDHKIERKFDLVDYKEFVLPRSDIERVLIILKPNA